MRGCGAAGASAKRCKDWWQSGCWCGCALTRVCNGWQVALPELDGALEPIVFAGRDSNTGKSHSLPDRIDTLCSRAINWAKCAPRPC